jgi:large subunit ribosomal protein L25
VVRRDVEVMADPDAVPEAFELDLAEAGIGDSLRWSAVKDMFGTKSVVARDFVVATIAPPTVVEETAAAPAAPAAPEAIKQKAPAAGGGGKAAASARKK